MLWVIRQAGGGDDGPYGGEFAVASSWLLRNHGDDPDAVRVGLELDNASRLLPRQLSAGLLRLGEVPRSKGTGPLGAGAVSRTQVGDGQQSPRTEGPADDHPCGRDRRGRQDLRREAGPAGRRVRLLPAPPAVRCRLSPRRVRAVVSGGDRRLRDVAYITARAGGSRRCSKQPEPKWNGEPLTKEGRHAIEERLARRKTLGQVAEARLDDLHNLAVGKPAPEIKGVDIHGKPLALSDYRGKVVALVFWGTWCGPCMREIPREKALVDRMKGRPFAMLGVNTDTD